MQSAFQFILQMFSGVEVRALCTKVLSHLFWHTLTLWITHCAQGYCNTGTALGPLVTVMIQDTKTFSTFMCFQLYNNHLGKSHIWGAQMVSWPVKNLHLSCGGTSESSVSQRKLLHSQQCITSS